MAYNQTQPCIVNALANTLPLTIVVPLNMQLPGSIILKSSAPGRLIEISVDNGIEYFTPTYDVVSSTTLLAIINCPITHIRLTGAAGDTYLVN